MADIELGKEIKKLALQTLEELVDEKTALIILEEAYQNLPELITNLQEAINEKRVEDAIRFAHSLKGVFATLGLEKSSEVARRCEFALKDNNLKVTDEVAQISYVIEAFLTTQ